MSKFRKYLSPVRIIVGLGVIILIIAGGLVWDMQRNDPTRVFNRMLATMLSSPSIAKDIIQSDGSQTLAQNVALQTSPKQRVQDINVLSQGQNAGTVVTTESIATPSADYVRYTDIKTSQRTIDGKSFNFSKVLGIWGKSGGDNTESGPAQLFSQTVLGVVPTANLPAAQRKALLEQIADTNVYSIDFGQDNKNIKHTRVNGRPVYSYQVKVAPVAYIEALKTFARDIGLNQLDQVDSSQYQNSQPLEFTFDIDVWSGQLIKVTYNDSSRTEVYGSYGAKLQISEPTNTVPISNLQTRLQQIQ